MSMRRTEALTLRTYPYSEVHKIAVFLTRDSGIVRGAAHGASGRKNRFGSSLEPLTQLTLTYLRKENQDLATIRNCEIIRPFPVQDLSWEESLHFSYFTELLAEFGQEQEADERIFRLAVSMISAATKVPIVPLSRYFELWLLQLEGVLPRLDSLLPGELAVKVQHMMKLHPSKLDEADLDPRELRVLERALVRLIREHLEKELKTWEIIEGLRDEEGARG